MRANCAWVCVWVCVCGCVCVSVAAGFTTCSLSVKPSVGLHRALQAVYKQSPTHQGGSVRGGRLLHTHRGAVCEGGVSAHTQGGSV